MLQPKPLRLPSVGGRTRRCTPRSTSTSRIMPPPSSARTRSWLQFHPSKASGRGLARLPARQTSIEIRKAFADESKECPDGRSACYRNRGADCALCGDIKMAQRTNGECAEELGGECVPESYPLQQLPQRYAFRDSTLRVRCARHLQVASRGVTMRRMARASAPRICRCKIRPSSISQPPKRWA